MSHRARSILLVAILAVAAALRLGWLDLMKFGTDEARAAFLALAMVHGRTLATFGIPSSLGTLNPPGFIWLLAPAAAVSPDPRWLTAWIGLLGVGGVAVVYRLTREVATASGGTEDNARTAEASIGDVSANAPPAAGTRAADAAVALLAAALLASSPWAVQYSRSIWAQNTLPVLTGGAALLLLVALRRGSVLALVASCGLVAWAMQVHYSAAAFALAWAGALAVGFRRDLRSGLLLGIGLGLLLWVPFLAHEAEHGWSDLRPKALSAANFGAEKPPAADTDPALRTFMNSAFAPCAWTFTLLTPRWFAPYYLGADFEATRFEHLPLHTVALRMVAAYFVMFLLGVGTGRVTRTAILDWRAHRDRGALAPPVLMLGWIALPVVALTFSPVHVYPHYFIVSLPAQALLAAQGARRWGRLRPGVEPVTPPRGLSPVLAGLAVGSCLIFVVFCAQFNAFLTAHPFRQSGDYRITYGLLVQRVEDIAAGNPEARARLAGFDWARYILMVQAPRGGAAPAGATRHASPRLGDPIH